MADPENILSDDDFLTAGELALGVLEGTERVDAQSHRLSSPEFAQAVDWWERRLGAMAESVGAKSPDRDMLAAIHARIDRLSDDKAKVVDFAAEREVRKVSPWSIGLAVTGLAAAAAALVLFLATPQSTGPVMTPPDDAPTPQLIAQLSDAETGYRVAGLIDPDDRRLSVTTNALDAGAGRTPVLWVIPEGGDPRSLGKIPADGSLARELTEAEAELLTDTSSLAVTFEEDRPTPYKSPTPPILLVGILDRIASDNS